MAATATPLTGTYTVDPIHSSFGFAVKYQGVSVFRGTLDEVDATLAGGRLDGTAKVEAISIRTPEQFRAHVLSPEFFDAANHPEVRFVSDELDLREDGTATVAGELTIKGITRPVTLQAAVTGPVTDPYGNERYGLALEAVIDRTAFGLDWNAPLPGGGFALANDVTLKAELSLVKAA